MNQIVRGVVAAAVLIAGEAGIGKTVLWKSASQAASGLGYQVLAARPAESESSLPFAGLADLGDADAEAELAGIQPLAQLKRQQLDRVAERVALTQVAERAERGPPVFIDLVIVLRRHCIQLTDALGSRFR